MPPPHILLITPTTPAELQLTHGIFQEYAQQLGVDLGFQNFEAELDDLLGDYAEPQGALLLAMVDDQLAGYHHVLLDTLTGMESARALYEDLNFAEILPYYHNPIAGAHCLKADL